MKIKHLYQPDSISCGPTCLKMIHKHINNGDISIEDIKIIVGTNNIKGTTLEDMIVGLNHLNIRYEVPILNNEKEAISYLNRALNDDSPVILRTLTKGIKHWVIATEFDGEYYEVKDPWLGEIKYNKKQLIKIWEPRGFDSLKILKEHKIMENEIRKWINQVKYFDKILKEESNNEDNFVVRKYKEKDRDQVMVLMTKAFSHLLPEDEIEEYTDDVTDYSKSIVVDRDGEIIGFYLLGNRQLRKGISDEDADKVYADLDEYDKKTGLEGVALVVKETERGIGLGSKLKDYTRTLGADYVWGVQYKDLGNLQQWLRRRKLAAENDEVNITVEDLN